jgi:hypothetical protein
MSQHKEDAWKEAQRVCRLSDEEIRMAKELGFQPKSLIKNIPPPSQQWKAPVNEWVRLLYEKKFGSRLPESRPARVIEFRSPDYPWPDRPEIPEFAPSDPSDDEMEWLEEGFVDFEPPSDKDIDDEDTLMLRRQCLFRWAAQAIAVAASELPEVEKVAAFGAVAHPLEREVPRFRQFSRHRIEILHECGDLDLAVWTTDLGRLQELQRALNRGLALVHDTAYGGVAHHQVDVHLFEAATGTYKGRLCIFRECPKLGKRECLVPGCGSQPFLQQFERYRFNPARFEGEPKVILFDRTGGYLAPIPRPLRSAQHEPF